jgi:pimeloyl-ACP methyl ester carboxylesterase
MEHGEGSEHRDLIAVQFRLGETMTACAYARFRGDGVRPGSVVVSDLHGLLEAAGIAGPIILVGTSAGGMVVELFARTYPEDVIGVVALNAVPPAGLWLPAFAEALPEIIADEEAYYRGANREGLDYLATSAEIAALPTAAHIVFETIVSSIAQCDGDTICEATYPTYPAIMEAATRAWPLGHFSMIDAGHAIHLDEPALVVDTVLRIIGDATPTP